MRRPPLPRGGTRAGLRAAWVLACAGLFAGACGPAPRTGPGSSGPAGPPDLLALDRFIEARMSAGHVPGLAAAIVKGGRTAWAKGFGQADLQAARPATADTVFLLASVSKPVVAVALMQLFEQGRFRLDDDISGHLPFDVRNPAARDVAITFRMLLAHTSSIQDNLDPLPEQYVEEDAATSLHDLLRNYLVPGGTYYDAGANFYAAAPGARNNYSNIAVTLAAYLVEVLSGIPFDRYCKERIFAPLGMRSTSWRLADFDRSNLAMPYEWTAAAGYAAQGHYAFSYYPSGTLRSSARDMARFLLAFMQGGEIEGTRILEPSTVEEMRRVQSSDGRNDIGLVWYYKTDETGTFLGHSGSELGVATELFYRAGDGVGVVLLMNGGWGPQENALGLIEIEDRLFADGARL